MICFDIKTGIIYFTWFSHISAKNRDLVRKLIIVTKNVSTEKKKSVITMLLKNTKPGKDQSLV